MFQKNLIYFICLFVLSNILNAQGNKSNKAVLIFIDQTSSITSSEIVRWQDNFDKYSRSFEDLRNFHACTIRLLPIHANTYGAAPLIEDVQFVLRREIKYRRLRKQELERLQEVVKCMQTASIPKTLSRESDILSTIDRAIDFFNTYPNAIKEIRFLSDMIQWSVDFKLLSSEFKHTNDIPEFTEKLIQKYKWPSDALMGVHITIIKAGITSQNSAGLPTNIVKKVDQFWKCLFEKLGAKVEKIEKV